uniref:Uncharacterized protein n=1 Tax=Anguilla anguilla TaxID=7936 RepID=A0A0E9XZ26_ANGAN
MVQCYMQLFNVWNTPWVFQQPCLLSNQLVLN